MFFRALASTSRLPLTRAYHPTRPLAVADLSDLVQLPSALPRSSLQPKTEPIRDDKWWTSASGNVKAKAVPGNQYSGRSIPVHARQSVAGAFKQLAVRLSRTGLRADVRRSEYHERPSEKKRRLASERHRRRFQEMVREKVQTVQMIRNRG